MTNPNRDYTFLESTVSICPLCLATLPAKIIQRGSSVYILKHCREHGYQSELLEEDAAFHLRKREYDKPGTASHTQTVVEHGCPFDCGLCPDHDQHTCIGLIEVTQNCDLGCPVCFASSGKGTFLDLDTIARMMDFYQVAESGKAEVLQISGGEPTSHPEIVSILRMARNKGFKYLMLNTNGLRIAEDEDFVSQLKEFETGFEIYLQFDGFSAKTHQYLRGKDLSVIKEKAIANIVKYGIPTTLVCTVENGVNDRELGEILVYGMKMKYIRGVNIQPMAYWGRRPAVSPRTDRMTLTGVLKRIEEQMGGMIRMSDFIPLPCNVERVSLTYLLKQKNGFVPIPRNADIKKYLPLINNTFAFKMDDMLREAGRELLNPVFFCKCLDFFKDYRNVVPPDFDIHAKDAIESTFRVSVTSFIDAYNFDLKSMQKECVHIITPDLKRFPFSAYNMLYRERYQNV